MKKAVFLFCTLISFIASSQNFTWLRGHNYNGAITGTYGVQGTAASANDPGHRHGAATWVDAAGNLWLFGGEGISANGPMSWLNDLWKFNPTTNQWTWVRGSNGPNQIGTYGTQGAAANTNEPGAREFAQFWTDASGNFWLFGGDGFASTSSFGRLADLWKYNPSSNQWTWMKGPNTINQSGNYGTIGNSGINTQPGARMAGATWVDASNNLWLWGGKGFDTGTTDGYLSDLWKYNPVSNLWTWVHGSNSIAQFGIYGTLATPSNSNNPGGREHPAAWLDNNGNFYLFGGRGHSTGPGAAYLNDLWKYNPGNDTWTWLHGANTNNPWGVYGTQAVSNASNVPGGRFAAGMWTDASGQFWLFGGLGWDNAGSLANLNDLWKYDAISNQWTWMKGGNTVNTAGIYGSMGMANANNFPGARHFNITWRNLNTRLWLFGGEGIDNNNQNPQDNMNDLWGYNPPCNPDSIVASTNKICSGNSSTLTAYNQYSANVTWYATNNGTNAIGNGSVLITPTLSATNNPTTINYYAQSNNCNLTPKTVAQITVNPLPTIIATCSKTYICIHDSNTLTATGANSYTWSNLLTSSITVVTLTNNNSNGVVSYTVNGINNYNCSSSAVVSFSYSFAKCIGAVKKFDQNILLVNLYPNPSNGSFTLKNESGLENLHLEIYDALGQLVYITEPDKIEIESGLAKGIYYYVIKHHHDLLKTGKLIID